MIMSQAQFAIHAAQNVRSWGRYAAVKYCQKRGCPVRLLTIALQLEEANGFC